MCLRVANAPALVVGKDFLAGCSQPKTIIVHLSPKTITVGILLTNIADATNDKAQG